MRGYCISVTFFGSDFGQVVTAYYAWCLQQRLTKKVESRIPICLQQLNQQMQGQCQDLRVCVCVCVVYYRVVKSNRNISTLPVLLQSGFDHDIEHYTAMLQTNLHSTPPALPPPAPEDPVRALPVIAQCRDELISARSLHVQVVKHIGTFLSTTREWIEYLGALERIDFSTRMRSPAWLRHVLVY